MKRILVVLLVMILVVGLLAPVAVALPVGVPVLVLENAYPWGYSSHISLLTSLGYGPLVATWSDLGVTVNLADYHNIYVASDQPQSFYDAYAAHAAELTAWVEAGGRCRMYEKTPRPVWRGVFDCCSVAGKSARALS